MGVIVLVTDSKTLPSIRAMPPVSRSNAWPPEVEGGLVVFWIFTS